MSTPQIWTVRQARSLMSQMLERRIRELDPSREGRKGRWRWWTSGGERVYGYYAKSPARHFVIDVVHRTQTPFEQDLDVRDGFTWNRWFHLNHGWTARLQFGLTLITVDFYTGSLDEH